MAEKKFTDNDPSKNAIIRKASHEPFPTLEEALNAQVWGFDIEDTLTRHNPHKLIIKLGLCLLWMADEINGSRKQIRPEELETYTDKLFIEQVLSHGDNLPLADSIKRGFNKNVKLMNLEFMIALLDWVLAIDHDNHRNQIIKDTLGLNPQAFWDFYSKFSRRTATDPHTGKYNPEKYARINGQTPTEGSIDLLNKLKKAKKKIFLITNSTLERAKPYADILNLSGFEYDLDGLISAKDLGIKKPDPEALSRVISQNSLSLATYGKYPFVYVGNAATDWEATTKAMGVPVIVNPFHHDFNQLGAVPRFEVPTLKTLADMLA